LRCLLDSLVASINSASATLVNIRLRPGICIYTPMRRRTGILPLLTVLLTACTQGGLGAVFNTMRGDSYALDDLSRDAHAGDACPQVTTTSYRGEQLRYQPALTVAEPFVARLQRIDIVVTRVALASYGRAPSAVRHAGAYLCRPIGNNTARWSEHAFGNAIDVVGFDFARVPKPTGDAGVLAPVVLPAALSRPFQVRVTRHWSATEGEAELLHRAFLHNLVDALRADDVFRAMIGPADPDHRTHLHLDMGPWRYERI